MYLKSDYVIFYFTYFLFQCFEEETMIYQSLKFNAFIMKYLMYFIVWKLNVKKKILLNKLMLFGINYLTS